MKHCSYAMILEGMVATSRPVGHGGKLDADRSQATRVGDRILTSCYTFLANEVMNAHTYRRGQDLLTEAVRNWGRYRGMAMRRDLLARGLAPTVQNLVRYYDNAASDDPEYEEQLDHKASTSLCQENLTPWCPMYDVWQDLPTQPAVAQALCVEVHRMQARAFNPVIRMSHPDGVLTSGAPGCTFRWEMSSEDTDMAKKVASRLKQDSPPEPRHPAMSRFDVKALDNTMSYRLQARLTALLYHYVLDAVLHEDGMETAETIACTAMEKWGKWRGSEMRAEHEQRGWPLRVENLVKYSDDPAAGDGWTARTYRLSSNEYYLEMDFSPYTWIFWEMGTPVPLSTPFWELSLEHQARAYNPSIAFSAPRLMERGDDISLFQYILR